MAEILVTGGTGNLGRELVPRLLGRGHTVRVLSRRADPPTPDGAVAVQGDLVKGTGLDEAVDGVDVIVHCAGGTGGPSSMLYRVTKRTDAGATKTLLDAAKAAGDPYVVYISIVGIDRIPLGYYRAKLEAEGHIDDAGLPYTILRTTQWHPLLWELCERAGRRRTMYLPRGISFQPLDPSEVAERMATIVDQGPIGRDADMGGPQILPVEDVARAYLEATSASKRIRLVRIPGKTARAFAEGHNCTSEHTDGTVTWEQWLAAKEAA